MNKIGDLQNVIPFNKPYCSLTEIRNIINAIYNQKISGDGTYTNKCNEWFSSHIQRKILLTTSCTAALEMMAILLNLQPQDEVIMPSYTFVSTANAFVLRGAVPVFVDIKPDTLNIDETLVEKAITPKTKAIVAVHYAGVGCEMDKLQEIATRHNLYLLEDAAQGFDSTYKGKYLGTIGDLGTYSFHETKNVISGEGGCLIINNTNFLERAEIIREKGTNRSKFFRGQVDKYTWVDIGSSYLPSDIIAAYLYGQLLISKQIQEKRMSIWNSYHNFFKQYEEKEFIKRPFIPSYCQHNAHMYYVLFQNYKIRSKFIQKLKDDGITAPFHYVPLHSAPAGMRYAKVYNDKGCLKVTDFVSDTLVRLPLFYDLSQQDLEKIFYSINNFFNGEFK